ncbi:MAG: tRNA glutamyl-Q(34) synthetase GluQRS [Pseudomonadota bacterium]
MAFADPVDRPVFRFAPSPNGDLHLGHALSALENYRLCQTFGGRFLLRFEDIDVERCSPAFEEQMLDDLHWLGLEWEEPVRRQSDHFDDYQAAIDTLTDEGLLYPAFLSRGDVKRMVRASQERGEAWPRDPDGAVLYPDICRLLEPHERTANLAAEMPYTLRLNMNDALEVAGTPIYSSRFGSDGGAEEQAENPALWGDVVLARKDIHTSYHLSVVVDDALQGVTHIVRGQDLEPATAVHRLLQILLGLPAPAYHHHRLILDEDGRKLSKSAGDTSLRSLRQAGVTQSDVLRMIGMEQA